MFDLYDRVKVYSGEHKGKEGVIIAMSYGLKEMPTVLLRLDDDSRIRVDIVNL